MKPTGKAEPRFDINYAYGHEGEKQIEQLLRWVAGGRPEVEVKRKSFLDLYFYIETHCDKGRRGIYEPSGINVTTSKAWAFVIGDTGVSVFFPTDSLRMMLGDASTRDKEETDGSYPTKGKLISFATLLLRLKQQRENPTPPAPANTFGHDLAVDKITVTPVAIAASRAERELSARHMSDELLERNLAFARDNQDDGDCREWAEILESEQSRRQIAAV